MLAVDEQPNPPTHKPLQFFQGFVDGLASHQELDLWLVPLMLLIMEVGMVYRVWIVHTLPMTTLGAAMRMILMAVPYLMFLGFLRRLKYMCTEEQIGTEVYLKLRRSVLSILFVSYFCLLFVGP
jgi:hypothetical protein